MPKFKWLHEIARPSLVTSYGPTTEVRIPKKNGTIRTCTPDNPAVGFQTDEVLKDEVRAEINFQDERSIRALTVDPRFEEVIA